MVNCVSSELDLTKIWLDSSFENEQVVGSAIGSKQFNRFGKFSNKFGKLTGNIIG